MIVKRHVCVKCNEPARNLRRGQPCPGCGEMTTVVLKEFELKSRPIGRKSSKTESGRAKISPGRRSDRGDGDSRLPPGTNPRNFD